MRLFLAIALDRPMKRTLLRVIEELSGSRSGFRRDVRWVDEARMHLTLKFLGEVEAGRVSEVFDAARGVADVTNPFTLTLDACGCFPPGGKVRVVWGGCSRPPEALTGCVERCETAFETLGFSRERRGFTPHLTVGRVRDDRTSGALRKSVERLVVTKTSQIVESITVYRSVLSPGGSRYTILEQFPFNGAS